MFQRFLLGLAATIQHQQQMLARSPPLLICITIIALLTLPDLQTAVVAVAVVLKGKALAFYRVALTRIGHLTERSIRRPAVPPSAASAPLRLAMRRCWLPLAEGAAIPQRRHPLLSSLVAAAAAAPLHLLRPLAAFQPVSQRDVTTSAQAAPSARSTMATPAPTPRPRWRRWTLLRLPPFHRLPTHLPTTAMLRMQGEWESQTTVAAAAMGTRSSKRMRIT